MNKSAREVIDEMVFYKVANVGNNIGKVLGEAKGLAEGLSSKGTKQGLGYMGKGAVIGGTAGAVTGYAADGGHDKSSGAIKGALMGAGMGALGGAGVEKHVVSQSGKAYNKGLAHGAIVGAGGATAATTAANFVKNKTPQSVKSALGDFAGKVKSSATDNVNNAKDVADTVKNKLNI